MLLIFWGENLGKDTLSLGGKILYQAFLDLYFAIRQMSFETSILFKSTLIFVISEILRLISSSISFNTVRYLYSISWISFFIFFVTLLVSLCHIFPCLFKASLNFLEFWLRSVFSSIWMVQAISLYLGKYISEVLVNLFVILFVSF